MTERAALRIGFDGRAFAWPVGGVRRYATELTRALGEVAPELQLIAIGDAADARRPSGMRVVSARAYLPTNLGWSLTALPRTARKARLDVFHAPAYTAPVWGVHPLVVTIHDVSYERQPDWYPYWRDPARRMFYRHSACVADRVITDSDFSRREIEAAYELDDSRVRVVPLGVSSSFMPKNGRPLHGAAAGWRPSILHVGDLHPRRNVGLLVEALAELRARHPALVDTQLVFAGRRRAGVQDVRTLAAARGLSDAIRFVFDPDEATLIALFQNASVFAYPSLYEGFGLPLLEAMACGLPVVASTAGAVPEVVGSAGLLVDPHHPTAWAEALAAVLTSPARALALREAGLRRAAAFSWKRTAEMTLAVYEEVAASTRARL